MASADGNFDEKRSLVIFEHLCFDDEVVELKNLKYFIRFLQDENPFKDPETASDLTQRLKRLLNSSDKRWIAICLMPNFLQHCSAEIFSQNAVYWIRSLQQFLNSKASFELKNIALKCISKLLALSSQFDEISRDLSLNTIHQLLNNLLSLCKSSQYNTALSIEVFKQCIISYPGPTGRFRSQIENFCLLLIDSKNDNVRSKACQCLARLPQCGSPGDKGMKFTDFWTKYNNIVANTLNMLWNDLLSLEPSSDQKATNDLMFNLMKVPDVEPQHSQILSQRICSLLMVYKEMMSNSFPNIVRMDLEKMILLCCMFFDVDMSLQTNRIETICINIVLPQIWIASFKFLNNLVAQTGALVLPYATIVLKMALKFLAVESSKEVDSTIKPPPKLRIWAYQVLCTWMSAVAAISNDLISKIVIETIKDICPVEEKINLNSVAGDTKKKTKKLTQKQRIQKELLEDKMTGKKINISKNSDMTFAALTFLEHLIISSGPILPLNTISQIQNHVLSTSLIICESAKQITKAFPSPYGSRNCRLQLFRCAFALFNLYHHQLPTSLPVFMSIFQMGSHDPCISVSSYCRSCLSTADKVIRPSAPALREHDKDALEMQVSRHELQVGKDREMYQQYSFTATERASELDINFPQNQAKIDKGFLSEEITKEPVPLKQLPSSQDCLVKISNMDTNNDSQPFPSNETSTDNVAEASFGSQEQNNEIGFELQRERVETGADNSTEKTEKEVALTRNDSSENVQEAKRPRLEKHCLSNDTNSVTVIEDNDTDLRIEDESERIIQEETGQALDHGSNSNECILIDSDEETDKILKSFIICHTDSD